MGKIGASIVSVISTTFKKLQNAPGKSMNAKVEGLGQTTAEMELFSVPGVHGRPIAGTKGVEITIGGIRIIVATHNYKLAKELDEGETMIYAMNASGTILGSIYLNKNSEVVFNEGTDYAVAFNDLKAEFNKLKNNYNSHTHTYSKPTAGVDTSTSTTSSVNTSNIDLAKVEKVRLP